MLQCRSKRKTVSLLAVHLLFLYPSSMNVLLFLSLVCYHFSLTVSQTTYVNSYESTVRDVYYPQFFDLPIRKREMVKLVAEHIAKTGFKALKAAVLNTNIDIVTILGPGVSIGTLPRMDETVRSLKRRGVNNVVNTLLSMEYNGVTSYYEASGMNELRLPIADHREPSVIYLRTAVEFMLRNTVEDEETFVHCKGGHGRSAAVVFAYYMIVEPLKPYSVLQSELLSKHKVRTTLADQEDLILFSRLEKANLLAFYEQLIFAKSADVDRKEVEYRYDTTLAHGPEYVPGVLERESSSLKYKVRDLFGRRANSLNEEVKIQEEQLLRSRAVDE